MTAILPDGRIPVLLSAHVEDLIGADAGAVAGYLHRHPEVGVAEVAATLSATRRLRRHRAVIRAADRDELLTGLKALAAGVEHPRVTRTQGGPAATRGRVAFVFPGQGSQWPSMGVQAYRQLPQYRAVADECAALFTAAGAASPLDYLLAEPDSGAVTNDFTQIQIQGAQFVHGVALARVWRSCGVLPDLTVGHSLGEIGAAYVAGAITAAEAVAVVIARATVLDRLTGPYRVAVLGITADDAAQVIAETPGWLELSVVNSRTSVAVSGDTDAVAAAVAHVTERGRFAKEIEMWFPAHTTALDPFRGELEALLPAAEFRESAVQFIGSATADVVAAGTGFADYWYTNLRSTVRFDRAVTSAARRGAAVFVEMSAHPALLFAMSDLLDDAVTAGSGRRDEPIAETLSANLVAVAMADNDFRWRDLQAGRQRSLADFPFAPMRSESLWADRKPLAPVPGLTVAVEQWERSTGGAARGQRRVAVVDLAAGHGPAAALSGAVDGTAGATAVAAVDADLLIVVAPAFEHHDVVSAAAELAAHVDAGLLGYATAVPAGVRDVWLVTVGGEQTADDDAAAQPGPAALAAMHRSLGLERPDRDFHHLDLPAHGLDGAVAHAAVAAMLTETGEISVRCGESGPLVLRRAMRDEPAPDPAWTAGAGVVDDVVITGAAGSVGMHFARRLAALGARRLVLLGRRALAEDQLATLRRGGVEVVAPQCDVTDPAQLARVAAEYAAGPASLVVHAAASAVLAPGAELTGATLRQTFEAKVSGLANLVAAWPLAADARILVCSSVSGVWGGYGHGAYSAANRLADVLAAQMRDGGRRCTAIRWGLWPGTGIIDESEISRVERSGLRAMVAERAVEAALHDRRVDPMVFSADAGRLQTFLGIGSDPGSHSAPAEPGPVDDSGDLTTAMRSALGTVLKLSDPTGLDFGASLLDLGVDSLLAVDLRKRLKSGTGRSVPLAAILGGATAWELIEHMERPDKEAVSRD